jgi:polyketide synthase PksN
MKELCESLAEVLYMEPEEIDSDKQFADLGMDSISGLEWIKKVNEQYGTSIDVTVIYDYSNVRALANFLAISREPLAVSSQPSTISRQRSAYSSQDSAVKDGEKPISLDELLLQVQEGVLDIEQAEKIYNSIRDHSKSNIRSAMHWKGSQNDFS